MSGRRGELQKRDVPQKASKEETTSTTNSGLLVPENIPISKDENGNQKKKNKDKK